MKNPHVKQLGETRPEYEKRAPWARHYRRSKERCKYVSSPYYKRGITNSLKLSDVKNFWFRDKAYNLERAVLHRINPKKNYTLKNCTFIEFKENIILGLKFTHSKKILQMDLNGKPIKLWNSVADMSRALGILVCCAADAAKGEQKTAGRFKWKYIKR